MAKIQTEMKDYARDTSTGALLNTNRRALQQYKQQRKSLSRIDCFDEELTYLRDEVADIKQMLCKLIGRMDG